MQFGASVSQFKKLILLFSKDIKSISFFLMFWTSMHQRKKYHGFHDNIK